VPRSPAISFKLSQNSSDRVLGPLARSRADELAYYLASIVESSDDAIISIDLDGIITSWNKGAERIYGIPPKKRLARPSNL
jgi:PAS domain-containing protein